MTEAEVTAIVTAIAGQLDVRVDRTLSRMIADLDSTLGEQVRALHKRVQRLELALRLANIRVETEH